MREYSFETMMLWWWKVRTTVIVNAYTFHNIFFHSICCFSYKTYIIICPSLVKYSLYSYRCLLPILSYLISFMSSFSIYHQIIIMLPSCLCCWLCTLYLPVKDLIISNVSLVEHIFSFMHVPLWLLWNHNVHKITKHNIYSK